MDIEDGAGRRIRIAHLQLLPLLSGVQRVTLEELSRLDRGRFDPVVICKEEGPFTAALDQARIPYFCVPELVREISPHLDLRALLRLIGLFRAQRFDIVHTHSSKTGILGRIAGRLTGVPVVMHTVHGYAFPAARNTVEELVFMGLEWVGARVTDGLVLLKHDDLVLAHERLSLPLQRLHLVPNGVDCTLFAPRDPAERQRIRRDQLGIDTDVVAIGMVGRLWEQKDPACFVRAAIRVLGRARKPVRFFLIGDGELRPLLEDSISAAGQGEGIRILGWRNDVPELLAGLDIFVLPSRWEGLSLSILEALSSQLPVVVSDISGNRDLVDEGVDGYRFAPGEDDRLAARLLELMEDASKRLQLGANGRAKVLSCYALEKRITVMEGLYAKLVASKTAGTQRAAVQGRDIDVPAAEGLDRKP